MTGAGIGGCPVAMIDQDAERSFGVQVKLECKRRTGLDGKIYY